MAAGRLHAGICEPVITTGSEARAATRGPEPDGGVGVAAPAACPRLAIANVTEITPTATPAQDRLRITFAMPYGAQKQPPMDDNDVRAPGLAAWRSWIPAAQRRFAGYRQLVSATAFIPGWIMHVHVYVPGCVNLTFLNSNLALCTGGAQGRD